MPVNKKIAFRVALEALHLRIAQREGGVGRAFRPREDGHETAKLLRILEEQGRVLNVPGVGWVNTEPAIAQYKLHTHKKIEAENDELRDEIERERMKEEAQISPEALNSDLQRFGR